MRRSRHETGFTVLEASVSILIGMVMVLVAFREFLELARVHHSQSQVAEMRQNARNLLEFLSRDMVSAGYGLDDAPSSFAPILANEPTVTTAFSSSIITIRHNAVDVWSDVTGDMSSSVDDIDVVTTNEMYDGDRVVVWDATGSWDWVTIAHVASATKLDPDGSLSKSYQSADDPRINIVREVSYRYVADELAVERMQDDGNWTVVARNVTSFAIRYLDETITEITPADDATREQIRTIAIDIGVRTEETDRVSNEFKTYQITNTISPRNLQPNRT